MKRQKPNFEFSIRKAQTKDAQRISGFLKTEAFTDSVLNRTYQEIESCEFFMAMCDLKLIGTVGLKIWEAGYVEIIGHVVQRQFRNNGVGYMLIKTAIHEATSNKNLKRLFALVVTPTVFKRLGFYEIRKITLKEKLKSDCKKCHRNGGNWSNPRCTEIALQLRV